MAVLFATVLFALVVLRFVRRAVQEKRRQRVLTWPRAVAFLGDGPDQLPAVSTDRFGETTFYCAELAVPYTFYARGERYTGNRLAPRLKLLNASEHSMFLKQLAKSRQFEVYFNPHDPSDNYLTVGRPLLTYPKQVLYVIYGLLLPAALLWFGAGDFPPGLRWVLSFGIAVGMTMLVLVAYFFAQPLFDLGQLLLPKQESGDGAQVQDQPEDELLRSLETRPPGTESPDPIVEPGADRGEGFS